MNSKLFLGILMAFLSIIVVSGLNFDNIGNYDAEKREMTIKNSFGLGDEIARIKLTSELNVIVMPGQDRKVAEMEFYNFDRNYGNALNKMEFYDLKNKNRKINREFTYKYENIIEQISREIDIGQICDGEIDANNTRACRPKLINIYENKTEWIEFDKIKDLPAGKVKVGIFTDVYSKDKVEWIPTFFGVRIDEWATWTSSLSEDLDRYYYFNDSEEAVTGIFNLTNAEGTPGYTDEGKALIGLSGNSTTNNNWNLTRHNEINFTNDTGTMNIWIYPDASAPDNEMIFEYGGGVRLELPGDGTLYIFGFESAYTYSNVGSNHWVMVTLVCNSTTADIYINGTLKSSKVITNGDRTSGHLTIGGRAGGSLDYEGLIDEMAFWSRNISSSEVTDLWNSGSGITYTQINAHPTVDLESPPDGLDSTNITLGFTANITPVTDNPLSNATLYIYYPNGTLYSTYLNDSINGDTTAQVVTWNASLGTESGNYDWNVYGCSEFSGSPNCTFASNNFTINRGITVNSEIYETTTYELTYSPFEINASFGEVISSSGNLNYNGTLYTATKTEEGDNTIFRADITIPIVFSSQTRNFHWEFSTTTATGISYLNTSSRTQTVNPTNITYCTSGDDIAVNFSIRDEVANNLVNDSDFEATIYWKLNSSSTIEKNNSFDLNGYNSYPFCIDPADRTFFVEARIDVEATTYDKRTFNLLYEEYNNATTNKSLYLLNSSDGKDITIELADDGLTPLRGYIVRIYRIQPSTGDKILVEEDTTNHFGQVHVRAEEYDVDYDILVYDADNNLVKSILDTNLICGGTTSTICVIPITITDDTAYFGRYSNIDDHVCSLSFNNNTRLFTLSWNDNTGANSTHRLQIERLAINGTSLVFNSTSNSSVSSLNYTAPNRIFSYRAQAFRLVGTTETRLLCEGALNGVLNEKVGDEVGIFGLEGMLWGFILLFTLVLFGLWSPPVGIFLYLGGFLFLGITQIIYINPAIAIAMFAIGVLAIWALRQ